GGHSWLLANPRALSEVMDNVVQVQLAEQETTGIRSTTAELRSLLRRTKIPARVVSRLLSGASPLWMMSERPSVLAADLALCHPPLATAEVRAVARPMEDPATYRLTVVAADRPGLLADSAAVLADEGLMVLSASVATWADGDIALHSLTLTTTTGAVPDWDILGEKLRLIATSQRARSRYARTGRALVTSAGSGPGRSIVKVVAPDGLGLLEAISGWFSEHAVSIEAAEIATREGIATDRFLVDGEFEPSELAGALSRAPTSAWDRLRVHRCHWFRTG
ncbi:MAG: hypothetical protein QOD72_3593, partial [Acidimicrobiaceae bacterium]|nr:hypothetical protein [Acidimicrobiaceae bacterium]